MLDPYRMHRILIFDSKTFYNVKLLFQVCKHLGIFISYASPDNKHYDKYFGHLVLYEDNKLKCKAETVHEMLMFIFYGRKKLCKFED
jgi:hypothetical protein